MSLRSVWRLPNRTHSSLLPLVSDSLQLFDEICRCSVNFVRAYSLHQSRLIRLVALHGIINSAGSSFMSQNVWFCEDHFRCSFSKIYFTVRSAAESSINQSLSNRWMTIYLSVNIYILDIICWHWTCWVKRKDFLGLTTYLCTV